MSSKEKKPTDLATLADVAEAKNAIAKEVVDIMNAVPKLSDGDPSNNASASLEIVQSLGVIGATLTTMAAGAVYLAQELGILGG